MRARDSIGNEIGYGVPDIATTLFFADDPLVAGTKVRASHIDELRRGVDVLRVFPQSSDGPVTPQEVGSRIRLADLVALRTDLTNLRRQLGLAAIAFTDPVLTGTPVRAIHIQQLRDAVK